MSRLNHRSTLAEIYLCHACSCHESEDGNTPRAGAASTAREYSYSGGISAALLSAAALGAPGGGGTVMLGAAAQLAVTALAGESAGWRARGRGAASLLRCDD
jgi:hypothetical protein